MAKAPKAEEQAPLTDLMPKAGAIDGTIKKVKIALFTGVLYSPEPTPDLISSMAHVGQLQPVGAIQKRDGSLEPVFGRRRIKAALKLEWTEIECKIFPEGWANPATLAIQENSTRRDNPVSEYKAIKQLLKERHSPKSIANTLGLPLQTIEKRLRLDQLRPELLAALETNLIAATVAEEVAKLPNAVQEALEKKFADEGKLTGEMVADAKRVNTQEARNKAVGEMFSDEEKETQAVEQVRTHLSGALDAFNAAPEFVFVAELGKHIEAALAAIMERPKKPEAVKPPAEEYDPMADE